jgi:hypothetical protein
VGTARLGLRLVRGGGCAGGFALDGRLHVEEDVLDMSRLVEVRQTPGVSFDFVF